jgi:hypothetical protein
MNEILRAILRLSFGILTFAVRGNQDSIVQRQIETMGLRQWLSLVSAWLVERAYTEVATLRDFGAAVSRQKPVKITAPTTHLFLLDLHRVRAAV